MDQLLDPPFAKDPPVKLDIPAKTLGLVYAVLGGIGAVFGLLGLLGITLRATLVGTPLAAWGGYRMYQNDHDGKRLVIYGLVLNGLGSLVSALSYGGLGGWIVNAAIIFVLYYLVIISRFEGEPKIVSTTPPAASSGPPSAR